jgi:hypothetical protein
MGVLAEFDSHCERLPLVSGSSALPAATLIVQLQFNHGRQPLFLLTATGGSRERIEQALSDAVDVGEWTCIGTAGESRRYQISPALRFEEQLGDVVDDLAGLEALATEDAIIERIEARRNGWRQTGWFADRAAFDEFRSFWQTNGGFQLHKLTRDGEPEPAGEGLTDRQQEALRTAYEMGYFEIPRRAALDDVAAELDISASSASERLRRAQTQLIEEMVATTWPPLPE